MWLPATPGWGPLVLVGGGSSPLLAEVPRFLRRGPSLPAEGPGWAFPRHPWLRVLGAVPRHFWLGSAGCADGRFRGVWWAVSRVACVCGAARAGVCVVCLWWWCRCGCVFRVCWCVCAVWRLVSLAGACCWCRCGCACGWCVLCTVPRHSWRRFLSAFSRRSWLRFLAGGGGCSSPLLAEGRGCGPLPLLAGVPRRRWCVVACHSWVRSWLRFPITPGWGLPAAAVAVSVGLGGGFLVVCVFVARRVRAWCLCWCVCRVFVVVAWVWVCLPCVLVCVCVCAWVAGAGWGLPSVWVWVWLVCVVVGPSPLLAKVPECDSPPLLAGLRCRWWWVLLATPGCGSRLRFPATPGLGVRWLRWWVGPCHSWLRVSGAVPRHSWLGSPAAAVGVSVGGGFPCCVCLWRSVCAWCLFWCVWCVFVVSVLVVVRLWVCLPRAFVCVCVCACVVCWSHAVAGPYFLRLLLCLPGCGLCVLWLVPRHSWRRFLCATPRHSWLGFAAGGAGCFSPLLAEGPGCGSPSLLAGVRRLWWCAVSRHSLLGPACCGGVFRGWGCPLLCVFVLCVAARGGPAVLCVACLWCPRCSWCGVVVRRGCVFRVRWCAWLRVCGVPVARGLLSPPLLVGACGWCLCGCGWCVVWVPRLSWLSDLGAVPRHSWLRSAVVWWWLVPCHSWLRGFVAGPRHSWLAFAARCSGWSLANPGRGPSVWFPGTPGWGPLVVVVGARSPLLAVGPRVSFSLALVCVCVMCGASCWCGWRAGVVRGVGAVCVRVCACSVLFVGCVISWLVLVVGWHGRGQKAEEKQKKRSCRRVAEMRVMRYAKYIPLYLSHRASFHL